MPRLLAGSDARELAVPSGSTSAQVPLPPGMGLAAALRCFELSLAVLQTPAPCGAWPTRSVPTPPIEGATTLEIRFAPQPTRAPSPRRDAPGPGCYGGRGPRRRRPRRRVPAPRLNPAARLNVRPLPSRKASSLRPPDRGRFVSRQRLGRTADRRPGARFSSQCSISPSVSALRDELTGNAGNGNCSCPSGVRCRHRAEPTGGAPWRSTCPTW